MVFYRFFWNFCSANIKQFIFISLVLIDTIHKVSNFHHAMINFSDLRNFLMVLILEIIKKYFIFLFNLVRLLYIGRSLIESVFLQIIINNLI